MPYRFAFLLMVLCVFARVGQAQENTQQVPEPSTSAPAAASVCSHVPAADTDSGAYNSGFNDGYKAGCKYGLSTRHSTSSGHLDDYVSDTPAPTASPSFQEENENLLKALGDVCKGADTRARKKGLGQSDLSNLRYRIALLTRLIENPPKDCQ